MNVEIGAEAALFPEKEYINGIFVAVQPMLCQDVCGPQHPSLHLDVSVYMNFCAPGQWTCLVTRVLWCTHGHFFLTEPIESGVFGLQNIFYVRFETVFCMFVSVVLTGSKHRNKPRNLCVGFIKQTEKQLKQCNSVLFGALTKKKI